MTEELIVALERALARERVRRNKAEELLEKKSRELFHSFEELQTSHCKLAEALEEVKSQQRQLVQSEKLASLGTMSAGVAHEINNPLAFIFSNINSLSHTVDVFRAYHSTVLTVLESNTEQGRLTATNRLLQYLQEEDVDFQVDDSADLIAETRVGIERVKGIVAGLQAFARTDSGVMEEVDVIECLTNTLKLANNQIKFNTTVTEDFGDIPTIQGYPGKLAQVFLNLIVNASQAMEREGGLTVSAHQVGDVVEVSFADTGCGMPADTLVNVFTPFFTTKPPGKGTGLGLSISHGIIQEHSGEIMVRSEPGNGTCFTVRLPIAAQLRAAA